MSLSFSADRGALSARLYAEGFSLPLTEAEGDLARLVSAGAIPLSLSDEGSVLSQGVGIPIGTDHGDVLYLYALTTDRAARGQGLLRTLLKESACLARARGLSALCLIPADTALADAYRRMGFTEERPAGGAPSVKAPEDLALWLDAPALPLKNGEQDALYEALGRHMSRAMFDFTLETLFPAVIPMRTESGYALALANDPRYALAASCDAHRHGAHSLLFAPLDTHLPNGICEPLPR